MGTISKVNTALQFLLIAVSLAAPLAGLQNHPSLHYLWAATGATTFLSAVSYAFMKDTYKFSHKPYDHQFGKKLTAFILFILFNIGFTLSFPSQVQFLISKIFSIQRSPLFRSNPLATLSVPLQGLVPLWISTVRGRR